ncbi:MAG TPA: hypothetical protein VGM86_28345 [Thermoanaerobaculia bacterium]
MKKRMKKKLVLSKETVRNLKEIEQAWENPMLQKALGGLDAGIQFDGTRAGVDGTCYVAC